METIILAVRFALRRGWRGFTGVLHRYRLDELPPVATIALVLVVGFAIPMALGIDMTPANLQRTLAVERLGNFDEGMPQTSPAGDTYCAEPAFYWPAHEQAARYNFKLRSNGDLKHSTQVAGRAHYLLPSPGNLKPGRYRFIVEAIDGDGRALGQVVDATFVVKADEAIATLEADATRMLEADAAALVMAGEYAARDSLHDIRSALTRYLAVAPTGHDAGRAKAILGQR